MSITKSESGNAEVVRDDVGGYSKIQLGEFLQGQLIAAQDRALRAQRRSDELEAPTAMPNRRCSN
jgi:hypothetical protein